MHYKSIYLISLMLPLDIGLQVLRTVTLIFSRMKPSVAYSGFLTNNVIDFPVLAKIQKVYLPPLTTTNVLLSGPSHFFTYPAQIMTGRTYLSVVRSRPLFVAASVQPVGDFDRLQAGNAWRQVSSFTYVYW